MAKIKVNPDASWMTGRNGTYGITAIELWTEQRGNGTPFAGISGFGKRDTEINGGFRLDADALIEVCKQFLEEQGFVVKPLEAPEPERLCDNCGAVMKLSKYKALLGLCSVCTDQIQ